VWDSDDNDESESDDDDSGDSQAMKLLNEEIRDLDPSCSSQKTE
jgi:hypothetical protein